MLIEVVLRHQNLKLIISGTYQNFSTIPDFCLPLNVTEVHVHALSLDVDIMRQWTSGGSVVKTPSPP